ncbi:MAG: glycerophosphodiester phosphodiesterase [Spirochaetales bacterium]|nr:glycerophosphodiester phosphodiesterase [Spirochaetales bacterium]
MNSSFPLITAHSGFDNTQANTIESVLIGIEAGADFIEVDVRATKDDIAVLFHDETITTRSHGPLKINNLTFPELIELEKNNEILHRQRIKITRIEEVIEAAKNRGGFLNLDLKDDSCAAPMVKAVKAVNMVDSVIISGCEVVRASFVKKTYPEFQVLLNANENLFKSDTINYSEAIREICRNAVSASCCGINIHHKYLSDEIIDLAYSRYLPVSVWTLNAEDSLEDYLKMGLYSITTLAVHALVEKRKRTIKENSGKIRS